MFAKFSRSWELVKASAGVLRSDKELLVFPVVSGIATLIVLATFAIPVFALRIFEDGVGPLGAIFGFQFYLCQYFVIFYFNSALVGAAMIRLNGGDPTVRDGLQIANERLVPILGYAAIAADFDPLLSELIAARMALDHLPRITVRTRQYDAVLSRVGSNAAVWKHTRR